MDVNDKASLEESQKDLQGIKSLLDKDNPIKDKNVTGNAISSLAKIDKQTITALTILTTVLQNI